MYAQPDRTPAPATPMLGDTYGRVRDPDKYKKLALTIYKAVLKGVIVVAVTIILTVQTGIVDVGDKDVQDDWVEVASQVVTGVFTWMAFTDQPAYICRVVRISRVLKASCVNWSEIMDSSIRAARYLNKHFPLVFVDTNTVRGGTGGHFEAQSSGKDADVNMSSLAKHNTVGCVRNIAFIYDDAKYLRTAYVFLNCGCFFQYVMSGYMWGYDASSRPGFMLPALLPPIVLCNVVGSYQLNQLNKRSKNRQKLTIGCASFPEELSSTRNSLSPL